MIKSLKSTYDHEYKSPNKHGELLNRQYPKRHIQLPINLSRNYFFPWHPQDSCASIIATLENGVIAAPATSKTPDATPPNVLNPAPSPPPMLPGIARDIRAFPVKLGTFDIRPFSAPTSRPSRPALFQSPFALGKNCWILPKFAMSPALEAKLARLAVASGSTEADVLLKAIALYEVALQAKLKGQDVAILDEEKRLVREIDGI